MSKGKKNAEGLFLEQRIWEIFLGRCLLRNNSFLEDSEKFKKTTSVKDAKTLDMIEKIITSEDEEKVKRKKELISSKQLYNLITNGNMIYEGETAPLRTILDKRNIFLKKWDRFPCFTKHKEDEELKKIRVLKHEKRHPLIPNLPAIAPWSEDLERKGYVSTGFNATYPIGDVFSSINTKVAIAKNLFQEQTGVLMPRIKKPTLLTYCKYSLLKHMDYEKPSFEVLKEIFYIYDIHVKKYWGSENITKFIIMKNPMENDKKYLQIQSPILKKGRLYDEQKNSYKEHPRYEAVQKEVKSRLTFTSNCIRDVQKLIFPHFQSFSTQ